MNQNREPVGSDEGVMLNFSSEHCVARLEKRKFLGGTPRSLMTRSSFLFHIEEHRSDRAEFSFSSTRYWKNSHFGLLRQKFNGLMTEWIFGCFSEFLVTSGKNDAFEKAQSIED